MCTNRNFSHTLWACAKAVLSRSDCAFHRMRMRR